MHKNLYASKKSPIQTINDTITSIINEREISIHNASEDTSVTFESLSFALLSEIGSYLTINAEYTLMWHSSDPVYDANWYFDYKCNNY